MQAVADVGGAFVDHDHAIDAVVGDQARQVVAALETEQQVEAAVEGLEFEAVDVGREERHRAHDAGIGRQQRRDQPGRRAPSVATRDQGAGGGIGEGGVTQLGGDLVDALARRLGHRRMVGQRQPHQLARDLETESDVLLRDGHGGHRRRERRKGQVAAIGCDHGGLSPRARRRTLPDLGRGAWKTYLARANTLTSGHGPPTEQGWSIVESGKRRRRQRIRQWPTGGEGRQVVDQPAYGPRHR